MHSTLRKHFSCFYTFSDLTLSRFPKARSALSRRALLVQSTPTAGNRPHMKCETTRHPTKGRRFLVSRVDRCETCISKKGFSLLLSAGCFPELENKPTVNKESRFSLNGFGVQLGISFHLRLCRKQQPFAEAQQKAAAQRLLLCMLCAKTSYLLN